MEAVSTFILLHISEPIVVVVAFTVDFAWARSTLLMGAQTHP